MRFEWDDRKAAANQKKQGVSFQEEAFADEHALLIGDPDHSAEEDRFVLLGASSKRLLIVCHCYREDDEVIRIISARRADKDERKRYRERGQ